MPMYAYKCRDCGAETECLVPIDERHSAAPECHGKMGLVIMPTMVSPDIAPYMAVAGDKMGQMIGSRREHKEFLRRNAFTEVGTETPKPIKNNFKPKKGEVAAELKKVIQPYLRQ